MPDENHKLVWFKFNVHIQQQQQKQQKQKQQTTTTTKHNLGDCFILSL